MTGCGTISSGSGFLKSSLASLDCLGRSIGSGGYQALTQQGTVIPELMLTFITLFIAWQGIRMMFGKQLEMAEAVTAVAKIGVVLMLMTSWPAVRTLFSEPAFNGPAELVAIAGMGRAMPLPDRLQRADDGIVNLTKWGTGKLDIRAGRTADGSPAGSEFAGIAIADDLALGFGRLCFLVGALMSLGLSSLLVGTMISTLPIFAGLLLFDAARGIFVGWLRLMFGLFVASFAIPLILSAELTLLEPWLAQAIEQRSRLLAVPSAPTELLALSASFLLILCGGLALIIRAVFMFDVSGTVRRIREISGTGSAEGSGFRAFTGGRVTAVPHVPPSRAQQLAAAVGRASEPRRLLAYSGTQATPGRVPADGTTYSMSGRSGPAARRSRQRQSLSNAKRDLR